MTDTLTTHHPFGPCEGDLPIFASRSILFRSADGRSTDWLVRVL